MELIWVYLWTTEEICVMRHIVKNSQNLYQSSVKTKQCPKGITTPSPHSGWLQQVILKFLRAYERYSQGITYAMLQSYKVKSC